MKRTEPTVSLLARKPDGTPAREYVNASHSDIRATFARIHQERERTFAFEREPLPSNTVALRRLP